MSDNIVEITQTSDYIISIDTSLVQNDNNVDVTISSPNIVDVINNTTVLISDLPPGYPISSTSGYLPISRVSGLDILAGTGIGVINNSGLYTISVTGTFGLTSEQVDDRISNLLVAGNYINISYNDNLDSLTISTSGLQPSGNYSLVGHSHIISDISGLQTQLDSKQPSGIYASGIHTHTSSQIIDFNEAVDDRIGSGLFVSGSGINLIYNDTSNSFTVSASGLINNPANNRILTSRDTTTINIDAESNLTFDGTSLVVSGDARVDNIKFDGNTISTISGNISINPFSSGSIQRGLIINTPGFIRGSYAVDFGVVSSSGRVASGPYSAICGGIGNKASHSFAIVGGGNTNSATGPYSSVVGGIENTSAGTYNFVGGGQNNTCSGPYSASILGGKNNTTSGYYSTVGGGTNNNSAGRSSVVAGGGNNSSSAYYGTIGGGYSNTSSAIYSTVGGGLNNTAGGNYSVIGGGNNNTVLGNSSAILAGSYNNDNSFNNVFILGSNITATQANTTYTENLISQSGKFTNLTVNNTGVSLIGHTHTDADIYVDAESYYGGQSLPLALQDIFAGIQSKATINHSHGNLTSNGRLGSISGLMVVTTTSGALTTSSGISSSYITNFNSSVSGLLPVKNIISGSGIDILNNSGIFTVSVTGNFGLTGEQVDDRVNSLLIAGNNIVLNYDDNNNNLTISTSGLQPSGNYSVVGHTHSSSNITDFNSSVSGLLPVTNILSGTNIIVSSNSGIYTIGTSGVQSLFTTINNTIVGNTSISAARALRYNALTFSPVTADITLPSSGHLIGDVIVITSAGGSFANGSVLRIKNPLGQTLDTITKQNESYRYISESNGAPNAWSKVLVDSHSHVSSDITNFNTSVSGLISGIYAPLNSPSFSGIPTVPTASSGTNTNQIASTSFVRTEISNLVNSAPSTLDTLNELATALGNDANFSTTITNNLAGKANLSGAIFTGAVTIPSGTGNFTSLSVNGTGVSISGHSHNSSDINNFNTAVSGLLPTIIGSGYINSNFSNNNYTISVNGLQPSGNYSIVGHSHLSSDITDFNNSVSGLLPVKNIVSGTDISVTNVSGIYTINSTVNTVSEAGSLVTTVFNKTGSPIPKMSAVYINGGQGDTPTVALAIATGDPTSAGTYGLTYETIPNMSTGKVVVFGVLTGLNTDQFNPTAPQGDVNGRVLYLSPSVSGTLTLNKPSAPNHIVAIGTIVRTHQNEGVVEVRVQNGFELEELHNVAISGVTGGQFLQYNSASGLWLSSSSGNFSTLQVNGTGVSISGHSHVISDVSGLQNALNSKQPSGIYASGIHSHGNLSSSGNIGSTSGLLVITGSGGLLTTNNDINTSNIVYITGDQTISGLKTFPRIDITDNIYGGTISIGEDLVGAEYGIYDENDNAFAIKTIGGSFQYGGIPGSTDGIIISPNKNVGIGIISPSGQLHVIGTGIFSSGLYVNNVPVSVSGHPHLSSDITNFNSSVSGLLSVTNIVGGTNISVVPSGSVYTVSVSGQLGLTAEEVDDRINNLLVAGTGIGLNYDDNNNILTINTSGLQPAGNYAQIYTGDPYTSEAANSFVDRSLSLWDMANDSIGLLINDNNIYLGSYSAFSTSGDVRQAFRDVLELGSASLANSGIFAPLNNPNFSGTLSVSGIPLGEIIDDEVAGLLVAGSGITLNYNDSANTLTVDSNVSTSLIAGSGISLNYNISTDELSIGLSSPIFVSGNNFGIGTSSPSSALDINSDSLRIRTSRTPASAAASGNVGDICWDANYLYVCVATNTWKRSAITTW